MRKILAALAALLLVGIFATAAHATVWKTGYKYCGGSQTPYVVSYAYGGLIHHDAPGTGSYATYGHSNWKTDKTYGIYGSGGSYWSVDTSGGLSDSGTYAGCSSIQP